tara:strand:+ start:986 stop:1186 length:201 start_codon:yes stop_codon:yes gene_type:complete
MPSPQLPKEQYEFFKDRLDVVSLIMEEILQQHPVAKIQPEIKNHISKAIDELYFASHKLNEINKLQ